MFADYLKLFIEYPYVSIGIFLVILIILIIVIKSSSSSSKQSFAISPIKSPYYGYSMPEYRTIGTSEEMACTQCVEKINDMCGSPVNPVTITDPNNTGYTYCLTEQFLKLANNKNCTPTVNKILSGQPVICFKN